MNAFDRKWDENRSKNSHVIPFCIALGITLLIYALVSINRPTQKQAAPKSQSRQTQKTEAKVNTAQALKPVTAANIPIATPTAKKPALPIEEPTILPSAREKEQEKVIFTQPPPEKWDKEKAMAKAKADGEAEIRRLEEKYLREKLLKEREAQQENERLRILHKISIEKERLELEKRRRYPIGPSFGPR